MNFARKRLFRERDMFHKPLSELHESPNELWWDLTVQGPPQTPYKDKQFIVRVSYESGYPFRSPRVIFKTTIFHPNITPSGHSSNLLEEPWHPYMSIQTLYDRIQHMLEHPQPYGYNMEAIELLRNNPAEFAKRAAEFPTHPITA